MANQNDSKFIDAMLELEDHEMAQYFFQKHRYLQDDSTYWNTLGSLWKFGGTVLQQDLWLRLLRSDRKNSHKIMKGSERKAWRRLKGNLTIYRAYNTVEELDTSISWTLDRKVAEKFTLDGRRGIATLVIDASEVFAYFNRRNESEVLINV